MKKSVQMEKRRATFADLQVQTYEFDLDDPDGGTLEIELRALPISERAELELVRNPKPIPPISEYRKEKGEVLPVYNYQDHNYQQAMAGWNRRQMQLLIIRSLVMDIPGDDDDAKIALLETTLGGWAMEQIWDHIEALSTVGRDAARGITFRRPGATRS